MDILPCILFYENIQSTNPSLPEFFWISLWLSLIITFEIDDFIVWFSEMISAIDYLFTIFTLNYRNVICHFLRRTCKAYKKYMCVFIMKRKLIKHSINIHKANHHIKPLTFGVYNLGVGLGHAQQCGDIKLVNGIPSW